MVEVESTNSDEISEAEQRVQPVVDALRGLDLDAISTKLDAQHEQDPTVGIAIINLDIPPVTIDDREYHFHGASFTHGAVVPHYHPAKGELPGQDHVEGPDDEPYIFITSAEMNTAPIVDGKIGQWKTERRQPGDVVVVEPNVVHSARDGKIAFACPHDHLSNYDEKTNPQGNRVMVAKLEDGRIESLQANGVPPQYTK